MIVVARKVTMYQPGASQTMCRVVAKISTINKLIDGKNMH